MKPDVPFASHEVRLSPRQWLVASVILVAAFHFLPVAWKQVEPLEAGPDYRVPLPLAEDYWTFERYCDEACTTDKTLLLGDSVVWGHFVTSDESLSHYLNELAARPRFVNLGIDGIHPIALEGLVRYYGGAIQSRAVVLNCNLLWMSSPEADLHTAKEARVQHPQLVPQFYPQVPCYREKLSQKLGMAVARQVPFLGWASHLRTVYFDHDDLPTWTIEHPYENPLAQVTLRLPSPDVPPQSTSPALPWTQRDVAKFRPGLPHWVELETSLQWAALRRTITLLQQRDNRVFVVIGPFNEHLLGPQSLTVYRRRQQQVQTWLQEHDVASLIATPLPTEQYADSSHPLATGYAGLAEELHEHEGFKEFR
ncbi:MAG: hypothetical protein HQ567_22245 [Candidatus Nealsonbacteria bacterium]|nr:hypothetical protein [Candidatus Nealsonbacteria bacterium]